MDNKLHEYVLVEDALELLNQIQSLQVRFNQAVHGLRVIQGVRAEKQRLMVNTKELTAALLENIQELDSCFLKEDIREEEQERTHRGRPPKTRAEAMKALKKNIKSMEKGLKF